MSEKKAWRKYVLGTCVCPVCFDLHGIGARPWLRETMRAHVLRPPASHKQFRIHCGECTVAAEGQGLWLWLIHPASDFQHHLDTYEKAIGESFNMDTVMENDLYRIEQVTASNQEKLYRAKLAGTRGEEDLFCPICQRTKDDRAVGPGLWLPRKMPDRRLKNEECKCRLCSVTFRGTDMMYSWRKHHSIHYKKKEATASGKDHDRREEERAS